MAPPIATRSLVPTVAVSALPRAQARPASRVTIYPFPVSAPAKPSVRRVAPATDPPTESARESPREEVAEPSPYDEQPATTPTEHARQPVTAPQQSTDEPSDEPYRSRE
jgi:hypothetical protein